jgi:hypothetical protein
MAHWAEINDNNIVVRVIVGDNNDPNQDEGYLWIIENLGGTWVKTSYNAAIRKNYAGIGFTYDSERDAFIPPKPYSSWLLNEITCIWEAPVPKPEGNYIWDEETLSWLKAEEV